jgi:hypothetical protein
MDTRVLTSIHSLTVMSPEFRPQTTLNKSRCSDHSARNNHHGTTGSSLESFPLQSHCTGTSGSKARKTLALAIEVFVDPEGTGHAEPSALRHFST